LLETYLKNNAPPGMIRKVTRLAKEFLPEKTTFTDWVYQVLKEGPWHLIHYAGHSFVNDDGDGYLFFPGPNLPNPVKISTLKPYMCDVAKVRFMYLSSCKSSKDDFIFQLASQGVPAILGFRWSIEDEKAKEFALEFYKDLFEFRSLDRAFLDARCYVHKYPDNRIWAAPMLILLGGRPV
jgi:CHAT domain-containing protein